MFAPFEKHWGAPETPRGVRGVAPGPFLFKGKLLRGSGAHGPRKSPFQTHTEFSIMRAVSDFFNEKCRAERKKRRPCGNDKKRSEHHVRYYTTRINNSFMLHTTLCASVHNKLWESQ